MTYNQIDADKTYTWNYPTQIILQQDARLTLPQQCHAKSIRKPLIVTDAQFSEQAVMQALLDHLTQAQLPYCLYNAVGVDPDADQVTQGIRQFQQAGCDGVICIGGGSAIDAGKAIALLANTRLPVWALEDTEDNYQKVGPDDIAPSIAIPTTAGTGAEVGRVSVIIDPKQQKKRFIFHPNLVPDLVLLDPTFTYSLPAHLTAATGLDAFTHSLEAFCAPGYHPMADGIALESMRLIKENLATAYQNPTHYSARAQLLAASLMGATAFQKGLGAVHALAHPLGARFKKHHGLLNAILLPYVLQANLTHIKQRLERVEAYLGIKSLIPWLLEIREALAIPHTLAEIGIEREQIADIGVLAAEDPSLLTNPVLLTAQQLQSIAENAASGILEASLPQLEECVI